MLSSIWKVTSSSQKSAVHAALLEKLLLLVLTSDLVIPKPYHLWSQSHQKAVLPLYLCLSTARGTEM